MTKKPKLILLAGGAVVCVVALVVWGYAADEPTQDAQAAPTGLSSGAHPPVSEQRSGLADLAVESASGGSAGGLESRQRLDVNRSLALPAEALESAQAADAGESTSAIMAESNAAPRKTGQVRGVVRASDEVLFSAKVSARIAQMPFREGDRFRKGNVLVAFDCSRARAEAAAAWASHRASQQFLNQSRELSQYNAIGESEVHIAQARADQTSAAASALDTQLRDCTITAPFSGVVMETMAHQHENAAVGKELTKVLNDEELEIHLIAPSAWLKWLKTGTTFDFRVQETGIHYSASVVRLGAAVDPVSQTVRLVGKFAVPHGAVLPGMSGNAEFPQMHKPSAAPSGDL